MLAALPGPRSLVLLSSESSQLSVPGMLHVPVSASKAAAEQPRGASRARPFPAAVFWDVSPALQGCPVLIKHTDSPEELPSRGLWAVHRGFGEAG